MDLSTIKTSDRDVYLQHPATGDELGLIFHLRAPDHDEVKAVDREWTDKRLQPKYRNKAIRTEELEQVKLKRVLASVTGWTWEDPELTFDGEQPEFSRQELKKMLTARPWILEFLKEETEDTASFF